MPKYLIKANYTGEGIVGLLNEGGSSRCTAVEKLIKSVGGSMEAFYYAIGDTDLFIIADLPDNISAAAVSLTASAAGTANVNVTVLMTPEEVDQVSQKTPNYWAPG